MMPAVKSNGVIRFARKTFLDESPQRGTIKWRNEGEAPFATQDTIVCTRDDWDVMVDKDGDLGTWAVLGLRAGLMVAISPQHLIACLGPVTEGNLLGL